jgi:prevent-host-death family protein
MPVTTMTSREFNQDSSRAKKAANAGPVFITDRGRPAHVLLSIEEYRRLTEPLAGPGKFKSLAEALAPKDELDFEFEFPKLEIHLKSAKFD